MICYFRELDKPLDRIAYNTDILFPLGYEISFYKCPFSRNLIPEKGYYSTISDEEEKDMDRFYKIKEAFVSFDFETGEMTITYNCEVFKPKA